MKFPLIVLGGEFNRDFKGITFLSLAANGNVVDQNSDLLNQLRSFAMFPAMLVRAIWRLIGACRAAGDERKRASATPCLGAGLNCCLLLLALLTTCYGVQFFVFFLSLGCVPVVLSYLSLVNVEISTTLAHFEEITLLQKSFSF